MNKKAVNLGIVMGVIGILLFLLMAILEPGMVLSSVLGLASFAVAIILPIIFIRKEREAQGGFIRFGEAFKIGFFGLLIGGLIGVAFQILYTQVIDPEFGARMTANSLEMTNSFMEGNMSDEVRETQLREMETKMEGQYTVAGMLKTFGFVAIFYAVLSLILAAILKRNPEGNAETLDV